jgi:uncharacterized membrane protein
MTEADLTHLASKWFHSGTEALHESERAILDAVAKRQRVARPPKRRDARTLGERMADRVAEFGGSWTFIGLFTFFLLSWAAINTLVLRDRAFDAYPYIFLNLILSMVAAIQAPIIMMSQNRQSSKDREVAAHDYEVNLKAELEIMSLHEKLDDLRMRQLDEHFASIATRLAAIEQTVRK